MRCRRLLRPGCQDRRNRERNHEGQQDRDEERAPGSKCLQWALQTNTFDASGPLLSAVRENASPESRNAFAWRLFEAWLANGALSKDKWAMGAIGHLGGDARHR
jgi:hypothetical protein